MARPSLVASSLVQLTTLTSSSEKSQRGGGGNRKSCNNHFRPHTWFTARKKEEVGYYFATKGNDSAMSRVGFMTRIGRTPDSHFRSRKRYGARSFWIALKKDPSVLSSGTGEVSPLPEEQKARQDDAHAPLKPLKESREDSRGPIADRIGLILVCPDDSREPWSRLHPALITRRTYFNRLRSFSLLGVAALYLRFWNKNSKFDAVTSPANGFLEDPGHYA
ncbi:hypothetical protein BJ322DRAFT_1023544 [Thelephora terrestris]|uniref:Uncharacterized protein n=1 Tax=Thelephora terrestris TaxID=56493 RepID=A0A9P6H7B6_9AGAM|nr:hypothetical protein BJ322DRAFT_1023544 [Thelephora terrestris]